MFLLDTHAWLWLVMGHPSMSGLRAVNNTEPWALSAISLWEVAMLEAHGRIELEIPLEDWFKKALRPESFQLLPLTPEIAITSARFSKDMHGDPADRIIAASAVVYRATLITADQRLLSCAPRCGYRTLAIFKD